MDRDWENVRYKPYYITYDLENYDLHKIYEGKMSSLDPGKYLGLTEWMINHLPWKVNPNLKLSHRS